MSMGFEDRVVVVTGGTGALGTAVVSALLDAGAQVHVPVLEAKTPSAFAQREQAGHERLTLVHGVALDDEAQAVAYYERTPAPWASIHVAGGFAMAPLLETSLADFEAMWRMNVSSCFLCCREAVRRMRAKGVETGHQGGGRLVNVTAGPALVPTAGMISYSTAKSAVAAMTTALAKELADDGIWVNAVAPSIIDTPANREAMPDADHGRWPSPEDLAATIVYLASPQNRCARGAVVPVFGYS